MSAYVSALEKLHKKIDRCKIISFDIFDTLLLRPYANPTDLFAHIEIDKNMQEYQGYRMRAEHEARIKSGKEDITIDEIYNQIHDVYKTLKSVEMDWEEMVLTQNPEMKAVWDYAKKAGKRIIVASDMYLPTELLKRVLIKQGFSGFEKIYVSGELGKTKWTGTMFDHIIHDLQCSPSDILHIGDNVVSDYKKPKKRGINVFLYEQLKNQFLRTHKFANNFFEKADCSASAGIIIMMQAMRWQKQMLGILPVGDYWQDIGYNLAGPFGYGFMRWVETTAKDNNVNNLLFVARDGYTLQKIFDKFDSGIKTSYVYAPRFLNMVGRLDFDINHFWHGYRRHICSIVNYFQKDKVFTDPLEAYEYFKQHEHKLKKSASDIMKNFRKYLIKFVDVDKDNIGLVDSITGLFSSQKLVERTLDRSIIGLYFAVLKNPGNHFNYRMFRNNDLCDGITHDDVYTKNWDFMEFLFTAPEFSVIGITPDGQPIHSAGNEHERIRKKIYPHISAGAVSFADDVKKVFRGKDIFIKSAECVKLINAFYDNPTYLDKQMMLPIYFSGDADHATYEPLFVSKLHFSQVIKHPVRSLHFIKKQRWLFPLQSIAVTAASPIKVKMHGIKMFKIVLFKKLPHKLFDFTLFDRYGIRIGGGL